MNDDGNITYAYLKSEMDKLKAITDVPGSGVTSYPPLPMDIHDSENPLPPYNPPFQEETGIVGFY